MRDGALGRPPFNILASSQGSKLFTLIIVRYRPFAIYLFSLLPFLLVLCFKLQSHTLLYFLTPLLFLDMRLDTWSIGRGGIRYRSGDKTARLSHLSSQQTVIQAIALEQRRHVPHV